MRPSGPRTPADGVRTAAGRRWLVGKCALRRSGIEAGWIAQVWQDDAAFSRARTVVHIHVSLACRLHGRTAVQCGPTASAAVGGRRSAESRQRQSRQWRATALGPAKVRRRVGRDRAPIVEEVPLMVVDDVEEDGVRGGLELGEARRCVEVDEVTDAHIGVRVSTLAPNACLACVAERRERRAPRASSAAGRRDGRVPGTPSASSPSPSSSAWQSSSALSSSSSSTAESSNSSPGSSGEEYNHQHDRCGGRPGRRPAGRPPGRPLGRRWLVG